VELELVEQEGLRAVMDRLCTRAEDDCFIEDDVGSVAGLGICLIDERVVSYEVGLVERSAWLDKETPRDVLTVVITEEDSGLVLLGTLEKGKLEPFSFVEDVRPMLDSLAIGEDD